MVTETDPVQRALEPLRACGQKIDLGELVVIGAESKLAALNQEQRDQAERQELRRQFLELTASGTVFDLDAAADMRERGWARG
jgi:hypothetical protein